MVSISLDTPHRALTPYIELWDPKGSWLTSDSFGGPREDAFISGFEIQRTGAYYIRVDKEHYSVSEPGSHELTLMLGRSLPLKSDSFYRNATAGNADTIPYQASGSRQYGAVAGHVMAPEGNNPDEDYFHLGFIEVGTSLILTLRQPAAGPWQPLVEIRFSGGQVVVPAVNPLEEEILFHVTNPDTYYAVGRASEGAGHRSQYVVRAELVPTRELLFADLVVTEINAPSLAAGGETVQFTWTVMNPGATALEGFQWADAVILSPDPELWDENDLFLDTALVPASLEPNSSCTATLEVQLPLGVAGSFWVLVVADYHDQVFEYEGEDNNAVLGPAPLEITLTPAADLGLELLAHPTVGVAGQPVHVTWQFQNFGPGRRETEFPAAPSRADMTGWFSPVTPSPAMPLTGRWHGFSTKVPCFRKKPMWWSFRAICQAACPGRIT